MKRLLAILCAAAVILSFGGCTKTKPLDSPVVATDLMANITPAVLTIDEANRDDGAAAAFAVELFKAALNDNNTLISPLSVMYALALTANGANGETLTQMETVLGLPLDTLNSTLCGYRQDTAADDKTTLHLANSVWLKDSEQFTVNEEFLQTNADYLHADAFKAPFDQTTCDDINAWVNEQTNGMIPEILDEVPLYAIMYLANALAFEAQWSEPYEPYQIADGMFTLDNGKTQPVKMLHSTENTYLEDDNATGFMKYYKGGQYAFVALLPDEGVSVDDYIAAMNGDKLHALLTSPIDTTVKATMPKFETNFQTELSSVLKGMGMTDAFDETKADFSNIGTSDNGNIYISRVLHKTTITVDENGTKAGAATIVELRDGATMIEENPKVVTLDRPFVYMLVDTEHHVPLMMGAMRNPNT